MERIGADEYSYWLNFVDCSVASRIDAFLPVYNGGQASAQKCLVCGDEQPKEFRGLTLGENPYVRGR